MKKLFVLICIATVCYGCKNEDSKKKSLINEKTLTTKSSDKLQRLDWMLGSWQNLSETAISREIWTKVTDTLYVAKSFTIVENDTVFSEKVQLFQKEDEVYFKVTNTMQNDGEAVTFTLIPDTKGHFVFENNSHDFPQRIIYTNPVKDSIHAWIVGLQDGKEQKVDFYFERVRN